MDNLIDVRQTKEYACFMKKMGWQTKLLGKNRQVFIKRIPFFPFSIIKILRCKDLIQLNKLIDRLKKYRPLFIKIQLFSFQKLKFKNKNQQLKTDKHPLIPTKTLWIDLKKSEKQLLKEMRPKMRYNIGLVKRKGIKTRVISGDKISEKQLKNFYSLWQQNKPFNWLFKPSFKELQCLKDSFKDKCFFIFAFKDKELVSQVFILSSQNMAFDWFGANSFLGRKLFAKSLVMWTAIREAKKRKLKIFDFEGIYDHRFHKNQKGWQGFSFFKKGFGGKEIEFSQPLTAVLPRG